MRALVLRDFYDIAVEERPDPVPGSGQAVVEVIATGICCSDFHGYSGENGRRHPGQIMGHETVGRVRELGTDVAGLTVGQLDRLRPSPAVRNVRRQAAIGCHCGADALPVGGPDYLPSEGFGSDVVALDVELCRRWRSRWRSCGSMTAHVNTWPCWSTGGPLPRLHVVRRAHTNRTTTAGSGRCAESEAAAIVTKVTVGQHVKLQVWTMLCHSLTRGWRTEGGSTQFAALRRHQAPTFRCGCVRDEAFWSKTVSPRAH